MNTAVSKTARRIDTSYLAALVINSNLVPLALADQDRLLFVNAAFARLFRRTDDLANASIIDLVLPVHRERIAEALQAEHGLPRVCFAEAFRGDTMTFDVELRFEPTVVNDELLIAIFARDVSDRSRDETHLNLLAFSDPLTNLGNRAMFADRLRLAVLTTRRTGQSFAVLMLDLDGFKAVNDQYRHNTGDLVLQRIAARLLATMRDIDSIARLGGDEFAVLLPMLEERADAMTAAERLVELAKRPINLGTFDVTVGTSVGVAIYPEHAVTVDLLLAAADKALYIAKRRGRGRAEWATVATAAETVPEPLVWNVAHEVGVREIDEQHARLVSLLNSLASALRNGAPHEAALREVIHYTGFHFASEERLMRAVYPDGGAAHRDMHKLLLAELRALRLDGPTLSVSLVVRYLQEWLLRHVDGADRDLAADLLAKGMG